MKCLVFEKECDLLTCQTKKACLWKNDVDKIKVTEGRILDAVGKSLEWQDGEIAGIDMTQLEQRVRGILLSSAGAF